MDQVRQEAIDAGEVIEGAIDGTAARIYQAIQDAQPKPEVARNWAERTPEGFEFSLKLYQRFTHPRMYEKAAALLMAIKIVQDLADPPPGPSLDTSEPSP